VIRRDNPTGMSDVGAPRFARPFVAVFLVAFVVCALATIEAWPLTGWRLFSHLRTDEQMTWAATAVDADGAAHQYPLGAMPRGYRGFGFLMREFVAGSESEKRRLCDAWREGTSELLGFEARAVRIYELRWRLSERSGDRAQPPVRTLRYVCRPGGVDAVA
jgi:hypothetical protein